MTLLEDLEAAASHVNREDPILAARLRAHAARIREALKEPHPGVMEFVPCQKCVERAIVAGLNAIPGEPPKG